MSPLAFWLGACHCWSFRTVNIILLAQRKLQLFSVREVEASQAMAERYDKVANMANMCHVKVKITWLICLRNLQFRRVCSRRLRSVPPTENRQSRLDRTMSDQRQIDPKKQQGRSPPPEVMPRHMLIENARQSSSSSTPTTRTHCSNWHKKQATLNKRPRNTSESA